MMAGIESATGGIDLGSADKAMQVKNDGQGGIKFKMDPAVLKALNNAQGLIVKDIAIEPMINLRKFLGVPDNLPVLK